MALIAMWCWSGGLPLAHARIPFQGPALSWALGGRTACIPFTIPKQETKPTDGTEQKVSISHHAVEGSGLLSCLLSLVVQILQRRLLQDGRLSTW